MALMKEASKEILEAIKKAGGDGTVTCTELRKIATEFNVPPRVVGEVANNLKIKIKSCELGCF
jgi:hypothetical protein